MDETQEMRNKEEIDECVDFIATVVSSYWKALIEKGVPEEVAVGLVHGCSMEYWQRHICILHGAEDE